MEAVSKYWVGLLERKRSQSEGEKNETKPTAEQHLAAASASEKTINCRN